MAADGVAPSPYSLFNRTSSDPQSVVPGGYVELDGPSRAVSASGSVVVELKLYDHDRLSPDDEVVNATMYWNPFSTANTFEGEKQLVVRGRYGKGTVCYSVVGNAAEAVIEIILINGDDEDPADVYGSIFAHSGPQQIILFKRSSDDLAEVRPGAPIPLLRPTAVVKMEGELKISALLWDHDPISPDDEIADGSVSFKPQLDTSSVSQRIHGKHGQIEVRVTWY